MDRAAVACGCGKCPKYARIVSAADCEYVCEQIIICINNYGMSPLYLLLVDN